MAKPRVRPFDLIPEGGWYAGPESLNKRTPTNARWTPGPKLTAAIGAWPGAKWSGIYNRIEFHTNERKTWLDVMTFARKYLGIEHWRHVGDGIWIPAEEPDGTEPCGKWIHEPGRGVSIYPCGRLTAEPGGLCKMHLAGERRSEANYAKKRADWEARDERWAREEAGRKSAADYVAKLAEHGVPAKVGDRGAVEIQGEVAMALVMAIRDLAIHMEEDPQQAIDDALGAHRLRD